jgi:hypothetical protein
MSTKTGKPVLIRPTNAAERKALEEAARSQDRSLSSQARRYIREGLRRDGYLED